jgi:hypothetical protein
MTDPALSPNSEGGRWANLKLEHGVSIAGLLANDVAKWNKLGHLTTTAQQAGPRRFEFRLQLVEPPPVDQWSLLMADALHSFRCALDTIAWTAANLVRAPSKPNGVYFPTARDATDWKRRWLPALESVPDLYLERMKWVQAFSHPESEPALLQLHDLDIADKHKGILRANAAMAAGTPWHADIQIGDGKTPQSGEMNPIAVDPQQDVANGLLIAGYDSTVDITVKHPQKITVPVTPAVWIGTDRYQALEVVSNIGAFTRLALDVMYLGESDAIALAVQNGNLTIDAPAP